MVYFKESEADGTTYRGAAWFEVFYPDGRPACGVILIRLGAACLVTCRPGEIFTIRTTSIFTYLVADTEGTAVRDTATATVACVCRSTLGLLYHVSRDTGGRLVPGPPP